MPENVHDTKPLDPVGDPPRLDEIPGFSALPPETQMLFRACSQDQPTVNVYMMTQLHAVQGHSEGVVVRCREAREAINKRFSELEHRPLQRHLPLWAKIAFPVLGSPIIFLMILGGIYWLKKNGWL